MRTVLTEVMHLCLPLSHPVNEWQRAPTATTKLHSSPPPRAFHFHLLSLLHSNSVIPLKKPTSATTNTEPTSSLAPLPHALYSHQNTPLFLRAHRNSDITDITDTTDIMASSSVNVPTNPKIKEQDVNAKLQLYGIYSGTSSAVRFIALVCGLKSSQSRNAKLTSSRSLRQRQGPFGQFSRDEAVAHMQRTQC
jgi:hypothetical protein